jgi:MFS family permease
MAELGKSTVSDELHAPTSALAPLREPLFRSLWIAAVISYTGTWMQNVGAGWLMASLTMSPLMVGLVQAATSLPVFLVVLPAGALADTVDRRRLLLITQSWMVLAAAALGILTILNIVTPWILLLLTFLLGFGAVMNDPAWQAITPDIVSREQHASAVALNSAGFNVARAIGPPLGGLVILAAGSGTAFLLNAASFFGVIFFLYHWKCIPRERHGSEGVMPAIRTGLRYMRGSAPVKAVLVRTVVFSFSAIALLALLPLIAKPFGSAGYGFLLGCFGMGALSGAAVLPRLRRRQSMDVLVGWATVIFAVVIFAVGRAESFALLATLLFLGGVGWIAILVCLNFTAQTMSPSWVRARSLSMYLLVLQGGMAAGSAAWGALAARTGIPFAMMCAAIGLFVGLVAIKWHRLTVPHHVELAPPIVHE